MGFEVVWRTDIARIKGRLKHSQIYEEWFNGVQRLKRGQALKIVLSRKCTTPLPSPAAARFAIKRWNRDHPDKTIGQVWRNVHTKEPVLYIFLETEEEG